MDCYTEGRARIDVRQRLYKPISETEYRVIHLFPGSFLDEIQCVLETRSFQVKTQYEAISYQWGDVSNSKLLRMAYMTPHPSTPGIVTKAFPSGVSRVKKAFRIVEAAAKRYSFPLQTLFWCFGTWFLWQIIKPLPLDAPWWVPSVIPRDVYMALLCALLGSGLLDFISKLIQLMVEIAKMKPWFVTYSQRKVRSGQQWDERISNFETLQVTTNLELALRYLRRGDCARTLWIDALCIDQENEDEKTIQIQQMDWIYANASPVVIWLGDCHGLGPPDVCTTSMSHNGTDCQHRLEIRAAFSYIWSRSGWRILLRWYYSRTEKKRFHESRAGLCELARRGWWERLWVIQEVALATGRVQMQCGNNVCDFEDFASAQCAILSEHTDEKAFTDAFRFSENFRDTIKDFSYSSFHDRRGLLAKTFVNILIKTAGMLAQDGGADVQSFHELPFAHKLHRILLKTSGRFKCHNDRDRLHAVLGIAGGATTERVTQTASFMESISSEVTRQVVSTSLDPLWNYFSRPVKGTYITFNVMWAVWGQFYEYRAKHWTFNRPSYAVSDHKEVIKAMRTGLAERPTRVDFFTAIARYLARQTGSLAFLSVATCGEDEDGGMPSWVPNWTKEMSTAAYDFANRTKKDHPPDIFRFTDGGKTLELAGLSRGGVRIIRPADLDLLQSSPWQGAFEKILVLPSEAKQVIASALRLVSTILRQKPFPMLTEDEREMISCSIRLMIMCLNTGLSLLRDELLRDEGTSMVYSYTLMADGEMGLLKAGEAVKGDRLVFVPSCYHHLVLRRREHTTGPSIRWKLVGLVAMSPTLGRKGYSKSEWAKLRENGAVYKYSIE